MAFGEPYGTTTFGNSGKFEETTTEQTPGVRDCWLQVSSILTATLKPLGPDSHRPNHTVFQLEFKGDVVKKCLCLPRGEVPKSATGLLPPDIPPWMDSNSSVDTVGFPPRVKWVFTYEKIKRDCNICKILACLCEPNITVPMDGHFTPRITLPDYPAQWHDELLQYHADQLKLLLEQVIWGDGGFASQTPGLWNCTTVFTGI